MMNSYQQIPSASSIFSAYASISASAMLLRSAVNEFIPPPIRRYLQSTISELFRQKSNKLTLIIEDGNEIARNQLYVAAELYLCTKISPNAKRLKVSKYPKENHFTINFEKGETMVDSHQGIELKWTYVCDDLDQNKGDQGHHFSNMTTSSKHQSRQFELSFDKVYKEQIFSSYLPYVIAKSKAIKDDQKVLKLCTLGNRSMWDMINFEHASTFDTLAMDPEMKKEIKDDLDRFVRRKEFYRRVGRAWKRGYLLYGPPGTGKSSLIAAMANYLKFDIYDLQLGNLLRDSDLRRVLLATGNRSILVIEDIDCSVEIPDRKNKSSVDQAGLNTNHNDNSDNSNNNNNNNRTPEIQAQLTLSGLLNFIDGLWSSCGDERIIIFTTNHKERLDPALLRPGRMDMHIHMSYLTVPAFKTLASNYLNLRGQPEHQLFHDIETLIENTNVSPAQVAEELMRSEDVDVALQGVVKLLKRKKMEGEEAKIHEDDENGCVETVIGPKRQKIADTES